MANIVVVFQSSTAPTHIAEAVLGLPENFTDYFLKVSSLAGESEVFPWSVLGCPGDDMGGVGLKRSFKGTNVKHIVLIFNADCGIVASVSPPDDAGGGENGTGQHPSGGGPVFPGTCCCRWS